MEEWRTSICVQHDGTGARQGGHIHRQCVETTRMPRKQD